MLIGLFTSESDGRFISCEASTFNPDNKGDDNVRC